MAGHAKPRLVVIAGPTGAGKTAVAVALARLLPIEVISADSRQVYRGMDAATGKPTAEERAAVVHHLIDVVDPDDRYQAARFRGDAATLVERIRARDAVPVVVGGTGLYIRALVRGLDTAPAADPSFRRELAAIARREGRPALWERLRSLAPEIAARLHPNDEVEQGRLTEDEALRRMQRDTVRYAKRQWTWFTREPDIEWVDVEAAGSPARVAERIARQLAPAWKEGVTA